MTAWGGCLLTLCEQACMSYHCQLLHQPFSSAAEGIWFVQGGSEHYLGTASTHSPDRTAGRKSWGDPVWDSAVLHVYQCQLMCTCCCWFHVCLSRTCNNAPSATCNQPIQLLHQETFVTNSWWQLGCDCSKMDAAVGSELSTRLQQNSLITSSILQHAVSNRFNSVQNE